MEEEGFTLTVLVHIVVSKLRSALEGSEVSLSEMYNNITWILVRFVIKFKGKKRHKILTISNYLYIIGS